MVNEIRVKGNIFNIQKFSLHDGSGIRTTVFFKGCPLSCKWCSNPESQALNRQILWDDKSCNRCKKCTSVCSIKAIGFCDDDISKESKMYINRAICVSCGECIDSCEQKALSFDSQDYEVEEVIEICKQDRAFYDESGGGVTISGGEPLVQFDFLMSLVKALKSENISVAIETTGYAEPSKIAEISPYIDEFLFDVKHYDSNKHKEYTGVSNERILENLKSLLKRNSNVLVRIPVIPDFNGSTRDAKSFAELFEKIGVNKVQLLPFHQFGEGKYDLVMKDYEMSGVKALYKEDLGLYVEVFKKHNIEAFF